MGLKQALAFVALGIAAGLALAIWTRQFVAALLYGGAIRPWSRHGRRPDDCRPGRPAAGGVPARRAAPVDPAQALKQE